jgi:formate dehydrogenase subunit gamma
MDEATTRPRSEPQLLRFDRVERAVHWVNAVLFAVLLVTAAMLYVPNISAAVGRRELVKTVHVYAGLALPIPLLISVIGPRWGRRLRADLRRLNRWLPDDRQWLRSRGWRAGRDRGIELGKFNPGQKLNAAFTGGAVLLMLMTGSIMRWYKPWPLRWRTGATFVHDWIAIALVCTITGHIMLAVGDPEALRSMWGGRISRAWARRRAPRWLREEESAGGSGPAGGAAG